MNYTNEIEIVPKGRNYEPSWLKELKESSRDWTEQSARCYFEIHENLPIRVVGFWYIFRAERCVHCESVSIPSEFVLKYGYKKLMKAFVFKIRTEK